MAKYRAIWQHIWDDPDFQEYDPLGKLAFIYLCTNKSTTESGIYRITFKTISNDTGIQPKTVSNMLSNGSLKNVFYDLPNHFVFVVNFRIYNPGGNPKLIQKAIANEFRQSRYTWLWSSFVEKYSEFKDSILTVGKPLVKPSPKVSGIGIGNGNGNGNKKTTSPSASFVNNSVENPKETVEKFINDFGKPKVRKDREFTDQVKQVVVRFIERCREWGFVVKVIADEDEKDVVNKEFGWIQNMIEYGTPHKLKDERKGFFTEPLKALELLNRIKGKPENPRAAFITAIKQQPKYLP